MTWPNESISAAQLPAVTALYLSNFNLLRSGVKIPGGVGGV